MFEKNSTLPDILADTPASDIGANLPTLSEDTMRRIEAGRKHFGLDPEAFSSDELYGAGAALAAASLRYIGGDLVIIDEVHEREPKPAKPEPIARSSANFRQHWVDSVPVADLRPGDHIRHPSIGYQRILVSTKPHPKGGVQVKTLPAWTYGNRCENPKGKVLKHHITGYASRWDGSTLIEATR